MLVFWSPSPGFLRQNWARILVGTIFTHVHSSATLETQTLNHKIMSLSCGALQALEEGTWPVLGSEPFRGHSGASCSQRIGTRWGTSLSQGTLYRGPWNLVVILGQPE